MTELMFVTEKGSKFNMKSCGNCKSSMEACYKCVDKNTRLLDAYEKAGDALTTIIDSIRFEIGGNTDEMYKTLKTARRLIVRQKIVMLVGIDPRVQNGCTHSGQQGNN